MKKKSPIQAPECPPDVDEQTGFRLLTRNLILSGLAGELDKAEASLNGSLFPVRRIGAVIPYSQVPSLIEELDDTGMIYLAQTQDPTGRAFLSKAASTKRRYFRDFDSVLILTQIQLEGNRAPIGALHVKVHGQYQGSLAPRR